MKRFVCKIFITLMLVSVFTSTSVMASNSNDTAPSQRELEDRRVRNDIMAYRLEQLEKNTLFVRYLANGSATNVCLLYTYNNNGNTAVRIPCKDLPAEIAVPVDIE